ncbi:gliding motility-associated ABC transporter permease subunit GldF [Echinicola shivajiensis]|uniref:gliding motility-associated ABC transporter permease subunit GldF n=1 Tax=Echinicola shivajiensis TaxID=1035916 RepID=UPI001BFCA765|nr:gliding motility-associated ABC transporter permease subunit GldF [Echinicola shivajiensis]
MISLVYKEVNAFFNNIIGYLILIVFLVAMGMVVWVFPNTSVLEYGFADLEALFVYTPYVFAFLVPAITMRMIAEEKKTGTWELLMTSPLKPHQLVLAKYFAGLLVLVFALLPSLLYYFSIYQLGAPVGNIDSAGFFGSIFGIIMIGAVFTGIGLFSSSLTDNQITAFILGVFLCFLLHFGFMGLASLFDASQWAVLIEQFSLSYHYENLSRGVIDSGDLYFFMTWIVVLIVFTTLMVRRK